MVNEDKKKIDATYLSEIESSGTCLEHFGDWQHDISRITEEFQQGLPYESVAIDNFLDPAFAERIYSEFPTDFENWYKYENPIEVKYAFDQIETLSKDVKDYFYLLSSHPVKNLMTNISGIPDLEYDEYLHGAGLHIHPRHGRLNIHLDYEKHPYSGKERRVNIILFMFKHWKPEWNGANELWNKEVSKCMKKTDVKFNRAIIFKTNDISWHGLPEQIKCPENEYRKSLAYYYVSPLKSEKSEDDYRTKAKFVRRPTDIYSPGINELYKIRPFRRIEREDIMQHTPEWTKES
jgi:Rps23 Pro-64 3,4-dihydroxylase Tpa1-like proline 4-hydroxylase